MLNTFTVRIVNIWRKDKMTLNNVIDNLIMLQVDTGIVVLFVVMVNTPW